MRYGNKIVFENIFGGTVLLDPAMEAGPPDLTTETRTMLKNTVRASRSGVDPTSNEFDAPNTEPTNTMEDPPAQDNGMGGGERPGTDPMGGGADDMGDGMNDGMGGDDMGGEMGMSGGDMGGSMMGGDDGSEMKPENARLIANLQTNINAVFDSVTGLKNSLNGYSAPSASQPVRELYTRALGQLNTIHDELQNLLEKPITVSTYPAKLRTFVSLRYAYSLVIEEIANHFDAVDVENGRPTDEDERKENTTKPRR